MSRLASWTIVSASPRSHTHVKGQKRMLCKVANPPSFASNACCRTDSTCYTRQVTAGEHGIDDSCKPNVRVIWVITSPLGRTLKLCKRTYWHIISNTMTLLWMAGSKSKKQAMLSCSFPQWCQTVARQRQRCKERFFFFFLPPMGKEPLAMLSSLWTVPNVQR